MSRVFQNIFGKRKNVIIGAIHFPPLPGYADFPGFSVAIKNAIRDLRALEAGGVDGVIFENNYDVPHAEHVSPAVIAAMTHIGERIVVATKLPVGISVLWNDYRSALGIAHALGLRFIRIPVFVDDVKTSYGTFRAKSREAIGFRHAIGARDVAIFADIHVKHSKIISRFSLEESARRAVREGADALIVTGKWTGNAPEIEKLLKVRKTAGSFPILVGSGADASNIKDLFRYANGIIVSTSLKKGNKKRGEVNMKEYKQRIDEKKVAMFVAATR